MDDHVDDRGGERPVPISEHDRRAQEALLDRVRSGAAEERQREREAVLRRVRARTGGLPAALPASSGPAVITIAALTVACVVGGWVVSGWVADRGLVVRLAALTPAVVGLALLGAGVARGARARVVPALLLVLATGAASGLVVTAVLDRAPPAVPQLRALNDQARLPYRRAGEPRTGGDRLCWTTCQWLAQTYQVDPPHPEPAQAVLDALERDGWVMGRASHAGARERGNVRAEVLLVPPDRVEVRYEALPAWAR